MIYGIQIRNAFRILFDYGWSDIQILLCALHFVCFFDHNIKGIVLLLLTRELDDSRSLIWGMRFRPFFWNTEILNVKIMNIYILQSILSKLISIPWGWWAGIVHILPLMNNIIWHWLKRCRLIRVSIFVYHHFIYKKWLK